MFPSELSDIERNLLHLNQNNQAIAKLFYESNAEEIAKIIFDSVQNFQNKLSETDDVAIVAVQFGQQMVISVDQIGYFGNTMIVFRGKDSNGNPLELIQHISQINVLLTAVRKESPERPKRKIGFGSDLT